MHPLFIQIRYQPKIRDNHRRTFQPLEAKERVANDVFLGFGVCGQDDRVVADVLSMGDAFFWTPSAIMKSASLNSPFPLVRSRKECHAYQPPGSEVLSAL